MPNQRWASIALAGCLLFVCGCQTWQHAGTSTPVPPPVLGEASLQSVRYQSPDLDLDSGSSRVISRNRQPLAELPMQDLATAAMDSQPAARQADRVLDVVIKGNQVLPKHQIVSKLQTRPGRFFDPDRLQQDVNTLWRMPEINRVKGPFLEQTPNGTIVTIEVVERPVITKVEFIGNRGIPDRKLKTESGLEDGRPLDVHQIRMAKTRLEELYHEKGYPRTQIEIMEGGEDNDNQVVFLIHEDEKQRIWKVEFEGNSIASDARLRNFIQSKPGILKVFGGLVNRDEIDQDVTRLTSYYRSLGFFNARIGREIQESNDGRWLTLRFIISEGPRYKVRNVAFVGNRVHSQEQLASLVELKPGEELPEFNVAMMNRDVVSIRELYGSEGFVFAQVQAEPRFLEEPGLLDLVYKIEEGERYAIRNINVHFEGGGSSITKREVALLVMGDLRPGDIIDANKVRQAERRLGATPVFAPGPGSGGAPPRVVVKPPELDQLERFAKQNGGSGNSYR